MGHGAPLMLSDPVFVALATVAVILIGISKGGFAGGLAMLAVPLLSMQVDPRLAVAVTLPLLCVTDAFSVWTYRFKWHVGHLKVLMLGALAGVAVGALTFDCVSESAMRLIVGASGLSLMGVGLALPRLVAPRKITPSLGEGGVWGALAGFTSFTAHAGGPPAQLYLLSRDLDRTTYQATVTALFTAINLMKVGPYIWLGQLNREVLLTAACFAPLAAASVWFGWWLHKRIDERLFYAVTNSLLVVTCLKLSYDGAIGLMQG